MTPNWQKALKALLLNHPAITPLVAANLYGGSVPQSKRPPYIVWSSLENDAEVTHEGRDGSDVVLVEIRCVAEDYSGACAIADAVESIVTPGAIGNGIQEWMPGGRQEQTEPKEDGGEDGNKVVILTFSAMGGD